VSNGYVLVEQADIYRANPSFFFLLYNTQPKPSIFTFRQASCRFRQTPCAFRLIPSRSWKKPCDFRQTPWGFRQIPYAFRQTPCTFRLIPSRSWKKPCAFRQTPWGFRQTPCAFRLIPCDFWQFWVVFWQRHNAFTLSRSSPIQFCCSRKAFFSSLFSLINIDKIKIRTQNTRIRRKNTE